MSHRNPLVAATLLAAALASSACSLIRVNGQPLGGASTPAAEPARTPVAAARPAPAPRPAPAVAPEKSPEERAHERFEHEAANTSTRAKDSLDFLVGDFRLAKLRELLAKDVAPVDAAWSDALIEKQRARVQEALSAGAEQQSWGTATPAPAEAAKVAVAQVQGHPWLTEREKFTFVGVMVVSDAWLIERSNYGTPVAQFKRVRVIAKREGLDGCIGFFATINHTNLGGSTYAKEWGAFVDQAPLWGGVKCPAKAR